MCVNRCLNFRREICDKEASRKDSKNYKYLTKENTAHVERKSKSDTSNNRVANGTISKLLGQYLNIPGRREIK